MHPDAWVNVDLLDAAMFGASALRLRFYWATDVKKD